MEAEGCSQQWKMHLPEFKHSRPSSSLTTHDQRGVSNKSVTMAPTSRYLTDRQYLTRKPLFTSEQHTSILKKSPPQRLREETQFGVSKEEDKKHSTSDFLSRDRGDVSPESFRLSHADTSPRSDSREDLDSPMGVSELRSRLFHEEPSFRSSLSGSRSTQRTFTSSILEVQRLNPPLRPRLTSTVLHPTYTPLSGKSRGDQTQLRMGRGESRVCGETKPCSSGGHLKGRTVSPHQANYWACAIPKSLPPSPDRHSAGWDPNREYQALLDYTYPLRPGQVVGEWGTSECQGDSLLQTDPNLQDSGIDLDHLCSSSSLRGSGTLGEDQRSPDLQGSTRSLDGLPSGTRLSLTDPVGLALGSPDCGQNPGGNNLYKKKGQHHQHHALSSSSSSFFSSDAFRRSTSVLPRSRCVCGDLDEEFWPLPEQLEELQQLSQQVRDVTAQLSRPVTSSWESLGPGTTSVLSSIALPERQEAEDKELEGNNQDVDEGQDEMGRGERSAAQTANHSVPEAVRRRAGAYIEPAGGGLSRSSLREVEALVEQLSGLTVSGSQEDQRQRDSLMQHIKVFCSHLEQLIQQLYAMSERMELLAAPSMDIDSVKSSLAEYQSVQREVSSHQPLVSCVLQTGHRLLSCMNATSPLLRDALLMIERQSGALENHTEHFFASILSAMDSLTQPSPVHQSREEDQCSGGVQGSTE
ncbi:centrosomal protein of 68 kDa isoform X1 [Notolabrus celidotus]|uniref:centrosomal protein of 68 kDa isoform X1 n=1 Tax=Notolabrus celidotus TaxID=1203425 RepID=UPI0014904D23|nr:centrosomal protein of 68 kDa isoform X1 [Notolabrus celidotus]